MGYEEFDPASWPSACAPEKRDWIDLGLKTCGEDGAYPEEFWNCADIAITAGEITFFFFPRHLLKGSGREQAGGGKGEDGSYVFFSRHDRSW